MRNLPLNTSLASAVVPKEIPLSVYDSRGDQVLEF